MAAAAASPRLRELIVAPILEEKRRLVAIAGALAGLAAAQGLFFVMVSRFFKALFSESARAVVPVAELVPEKVLAYFPAYRDATVSSDALVLAVPAVMLVAGCAWAFATYVFQLNQQAIALYVARRYREKLFKALLSSPYLEIRKRAVGEWMSIVMNDVMFLQMRLSDLLVGLVRDSVVVVAGFCYLAWMHWPTALVMALLAPFASMGMGRTGKRIARYSEAFQRELGRIAATVLDLRARFDMIRAQSGEAREAGRFARLNLAYYRMIRRSILIRSAFAPALEAFGFVVFAGIVYAIGTGLWAGFKPEMIGPFLFAFGVMLKPLKELGEQLTRWHETRGVLKWSMDTFAALDAPAAAEGLRKAAGAGNPSSEARGLLVRRVSAGFGGETKFQAEKLGVDAGKAIAVIGPSGAGKSTFVKVLAGLVEPTQWDADVSWNDATSRVSMVSQEPFLFDDTVLANLIYGLAADRIPDEAAVWRALAAVNVDAEVRALPEGLGARMRAIGATVSGGQLQRLVIARALLRRQPILALDEATSAIDVKSERDITKRLIAACHDDKLALIAVTHRLQWLDQYDEVWFVERGRRVFAGPHATLLGEPRYRDYCQTQGTGEGGGDDATTA